MQDIIAGGSPIESLREEESRKDGAYHKERAERMVLATRKEVHAVQDDLRHSHNLKLWTLYFCGR
jgi:hypothetical protein